MATMAIPINEITPVVFEAKRKTECVVECAKAERADTATLWTIARKTLSLKWKFSHLVARQSRFITRLVEQDFSQSTPAELTQLGGALDSLLSEERELLDMVHLLGAEIRFWWADSLSKLANQVEHLDSISESLHVAADAEVSALLATAIEQVAV